MKRYILTLIAALTALASAEAMSYERAREEALYLTDKMAYELNLNDQQYNDAYEINLDYFLSMNTERDLYEDYLSYRLTDLRHILLSWQFDLMLQADYFVRPLLWSRGAWAFPIYSHYRRDVFFYDRPRVFFDYHGGHDRHHFDHGFYAGRRPHWDGGMRGREPMGGPGRPDGRVQPGRGDGYHFDLPGQGAQRPGRDGMGGRGDNGYGPGRDNQPGRTPGGYRDGRDNQTGGTPGGYRDGRDNQTGGGYNGTEGTRGGYTPGRTGTTAPTREGTARPDRNSTARPGQGGATRSYDRTPSMPSRSTSTGTRPGYSGPSTGRGNSFTRSSSRATTGAGGYSTPSRGAGVSRGSSAAPSRGGSMDAPARGGGAPARSGAQGGGTVSRGRR